MEKVGDSNLTYIRARRRLIRNEIAMDNSLDWGRNSGNSHLVDPSHLLLPNVPMGSECEQLGEWEILLQYKD